MEYNHYGVTAREWPQQLESKRRADQSHETRPFRDTISIEQMDY